MSVENKNINDLDDYNRIRFIDNFEQRLQRLRKGLQINRDLFTENQNIEMVVWNNGIEDFV